MFTKTKVYVLLICGSLFAVYLFSQRFSNSVLNKPLSYSAQIDIFKYRHIDGEYSVLPNKYAKAKNTNTIVTTQTESILNWTVLPTTTSTLRTSGVRMTLKIESKNVADRRAKYCNFQADTTKMASASHGRVYAYNAYNHPTFTLNFKNPCFLQGVNYKSSEDIRCVPYFLLPGFPKCATTSVWEGLKVHPRIKLLHFKEPNFLHRLDRGGLPFTDAVKNYTDTFAESTKAIMSSPHFVNRETFYDQITGEASVDYSFDNRYWPLYPGNENCREPAVTLADFAHRLNPNMKIIFVVRDPVERLYSDYVFESLFLGYPVSKQGFHQRVLSTIAAHKLCRKYQSARACAYNSSLETWEVRLRVGMYHVFIEDWAAVFTANNIAVIRTEELDEDRKLETYRKLFKFLDVRRYFPSS